VELWRHLRGNVSFTYGPEYWTMVFPLGMYAVATFKVVEVTGVAFLSSISEFFAYVALLAWVIVFIGMCHSLARLRPRHN
jgi:tellurite resistance protein TehA-like permease